MKSLLLSGAVVVSVASCQSAPEKKPAPAPVPLPSSPVESAPVSQPTPARTVDSSGVVTTASGLRYKVLSSGPAEGRSPTLFDNVLVHYRGTLTDGTVFDSSYERGSPASFGVGQVIPGWTEALRLMKPGDKWMLHIPAHLAYGNRAVGGKIPPNSDLLFQVELLQVIGGL